MEKLFLNEDELIENSFRLGVQIFASGFRPTYIVGLWRGGSSVGIYVQECLQTLGVSAEHMSLRTSYQGLSHYSKMIDEPQSIRVHGTQYLIEHMNAEDSLLIVDDVFSTGLSIQATLERLKKHLKKNMPTDVRIATLYQRTGFQRASFEPDYVFDKTAKWLVFPYELTGLTHAEIQQHKPYVAPLLLSGAL